MKTDFSIQFSWGKMYSKGNLFRSGLCFILILFIFLPITPRNRNTRVLIELKDKSNLKGELFEVTRDEIIIYDNGVVKRIDISRIKTVGIKKKSLFGKGILWGGGLGFAFGGVLALTSKADTTGLLYSSETGEFFAVAIVCSLVGLVYGAVIGKILAMYRHYNFSTFTEFKRMKFLKKLKKLARI